MLSRKSKYGLKALLVLAAGDAGIAGIAGIPGISGARRPVLISELADREAIPKKFLEAILLELKRHGILESRKGKGGGYFLRRPADDITFGEVIRVLDGPLAAVPCVSQTAYMKCAECLDEQRCGVRLAMKQVRDATARILDHTTLAGVNARLAPPRRARRPAARLRAPNAPKIRKARQARKATS